MFRVALRSAVVILLGTACAAGVQATVPQDEAPLIRTQTRLVLEDLLVTDRKGNPVHGLPASAFHLFDNGQPQRIRDFVEGAPAAAPRATPLNLPVGTFSNQPPDGQPSTTEVLLLDADNTALLDQMYLFKQLESAVDRMPPDLPVSVFSVANGRATPLLIASTDRAALHRSLKEAMPVQTIPVEGRFNNAVNQLFTAAAYLQQTPGRKNLLWFAGNFPLMSLAPGDQAAGASADYTAREHQIHLVQEALAEARISVFPVDPRGVLGTLDGDAGGVSAGAGAGAGRNPRAASTASAGRSTGASLSTNDSDARSQMRKLAEATGGRAYFLNNLTKEIDQVFDLGRSAYTLSYSPRPYALDQSWHTIRVEVDGDYQVSYRRGYLATLTGAEAVPQRSRLTRDGARQVDPNLHIPIVFQVKIVPGSSQQVELALSIPLKELHMDHQHGTWTNALVVSSYVYDSLGKVRDGKMQELDTRLDDSAYTRAQAAGQNVATRQRLQVPKSARYLLVTVRDPGSQRIGSLLLRTELLASLPTANAAATPPANAGPS